MTSEYAPGGNFSDPLPSYVKHAIGIEDYDDYYRDVYGILEKEIEIDKYYLLLENDIIEGGGGSKMVYLHPVSMNSNGVIPPNFISGYELLQLSVYKNK